MGAEGHIQIGCKITAFHAHECVNFCKKRRIFDIFAILTLQKTIFRLHICEKSSIFASKLRFIQPSEENSPHMLSTLAQPLRRRAGAERKHASRCIYAGEKREADLQRTALLLSRGQLGG